MSTTTNLTTLKINYLTQAQYDTALANNQINEDEIYLTPDTSAQPTLYTFNATASGSAAYWFYTITVADSSVYNLEYLLHNSKFWFSRTSSGVTSIYGPMAIGVSAATSTTIKYTISYASSYYPTTTNLDTVYASTPINIEGVFTYTM